VLEGQRAPHASALVIETGRKMSLTQATMLVAGNMIGTGVFLLPVNLAQVGGIAIFGWVIATVGVAALGLVFAKLGQLNPQQGGPYAYARDFLGPYAGFQTNYVYWFGNWIGNIAIAVAAVGYLSELVPSVVGPPGSVVATAAVIWLLTFANILGPRMVGALETWTMALALIPIVGIALLGWFWFDSATFLAGWNVSGGTDMHAVSRAASMALWAYMGIESASVSAGVIENPTRNVPLATLIGLGVAAVVYVLSSTVIMGILPNGELRTSPAPFAEAARLALGAPGAILISVCAVLKSVGSLGGWMLLVGQSAKAAADDGMFPGVFARLNRYGVPGPGLIIVAVLMTVVLFATVSPTLAGQFNQIVDLAVILVIVPYVYSAVAVVKVIFDRQLPARTFRTYKWLALAAVAYCLWAVVGGDPQTVVHAMVALLVSVPLYPFFIRSMEAAAQRRASRAGSADFRSASPASNAVTQ
jgi:arginine:agmatine antiporter